MLFCWRNGFYSYFCVLAAATELVGEEREAHSLIANVAGRVLMLQKDKPAAERSTKKVGVAYFLVLCS